MLATLLIIVSVIAFSQSGLVFLSPVYGGGHAASPVNAVPKIDAMINADYPSTSTTSSSVVYATPSVVSNSTASSSMSPYVTSTAVSSVTSSYSVTATTVSTLTISAVQTVNPDFALSVSDPVVYLPPGDFVGTTRFTLTVNAIGGWVGPLQFTTSLLPAGIALFNMPWMYWLNSAIASWYVQVAIGPSVWSGSYSLVLTAISGSTVHSTVVTIIVQSPVVFPNFSQFLGLVTVLVFTVMVGNRRYP